MTDMVARLAQIRVLPLIQADSITKALQSVEKLVSDGKTIVEVVLRTESALSCIDVIEQHYPQVSVGAGTVLNKRQAIQATEAGAQFLVSPGFDTGVYEHAKQAGIDYFPGCATATEVLNARNLGVRTLKFFPAIASGGVPMLEALGAVFSDVQFIPTGGINVSNLEEFLALPNVLACGGSWLTTSK